MGDYIVRATAAGGQVRAFAATTKGLVEEAKERHNMSPIATVALGRLLTGGAMMGTMMKNDADILTVQIKGNGPIGSMTVTANPKGEVKGFVGNPQVMLPLKEGKLDIADAVGIGVLRILDLKSHMLVILFLSQVRLQMTLLIILLTVSRFHLL